MKAGMTEEQKSHSIFDVPVFKLRKDEKTVILIIETEFETEYTHWVDETGYVFCLGDYKTMLQTNLDLQRCPLCKASQSYKSIGSGRRKFVSLICHFRTNTKGQVLTPISFDIKPWVFGDDKFNDLVGKKEQWKDLRRHDIQVECTGEQYQKFRMEIMPEALWLKVGNEQLKVAVATAYKEARQQFEKDLRMLIGRDIQEPERLTEIITKASGSVVVPGYASQEELDAALSGEGATAPAAEADFSDLLPKEHKEGEVESGTVEKAADASQGSAAAAAQQAGDLDFDGLLD